MMKYNEELKKAGVLLALDGLHPPSSGARVSFNGGKPIVTDGPFAEAKEVLGGYWMIDVRSREQAIEWARRCPASENHVIEIRRIHEMSEFPEDGSKGGGLSELNASASARVSFNGARGRRMQLIQGQQHAGLLQFLVVFHHRCHRFRAKHGVGRRGCVAGGDHQHHETHGCFSVVGPITRRTRNGGIDRSSRN
jgi:hypothetical protein